MEVRSAEVVRFLDIGEAVRAENLLPERGKLLISDLEFIDYPFQVDGDRLGLDGIFVTEGLYRFASRNVLPIALKTLHEREQDIKDLAEHGPQMMRRVFGVVDFHAEVGLAELETLGDGRGRHPDVDAVAGHVGLPDVLFGKELAYVSGKSEIPADGLPDPLAVQGAGKVVEGVVGERRVVFVSQVDGRDELEIMVDHGVQEILNPV